MDELVNPMEKMTKNVRSLTLQHYFLKKNRYKSHFFHRNFDVIEKKTHFLQWYQYIILNIAANI